jgi:hypothetical protein
MTLQKLGGVAALIEAFAYVVGFAVLATLMSPEYAADWNAQQKLAFLLERKLVVQLWNLTIYVVFGVFLVVLVIALHERLKAGALAMVQVASAFGLIWCGLVIASGMVANVGLETVGRVFPKDPASAVSAWLAIGAVQDALGGGVELVGGLWVVLISWAALRSGALTERLNYLGLVVGMAGVLTLIPGLSDLGSIFGLGQIVWFAWLGIHLLRKSAPPHQFR